MRNISKAIKSETSNTTLSRLVGDRIFYGRAPQKTPYPYVVYFLAADTQIDTFKTKMDDTIVQFSIFSSAQSATEIENIYDALEDVFDDATLSMTGLTQCLMYRQNTIRTSEDVGATPDGSSEVWHYIVDYKLIIERG